jgi:hypothetical protein
MRNNGNVSKGPIVSMFSRIGFVSMPEDYFFRPMGLLFLVGLNLFSQLSS